MKKPLFGRAQRRLEDIMAEQVNVKNTGLRGVTVADTKVSFIEVVHLLLSGALPNRTFNSMWTFTVRRSTISWEYRGI